MSVRFSISYLSSRHLWLLVVLVLVQLCLSDQNPGDALCMDGERQALFRFKQGLIDEAGRLSSWVGEKSDCCKWAGIVCDNMTNHVHEIHLPGLDGHCVRSDFSTYVEFREASKQMLRGHLSPSLLELKQLKHLDLSCNDFKDIQIPSFIGSFRNLRYLNLSRSNFSGTIPPQIGNISELRVLSLHLDGVSMTKMQWLSSLRWLQHLDMSGIDLFNVVDWFQVINSLPSLVKLVLSGCDIRDMHPRVTNLNVTSLLLLDLSNNYLIFTSTPLWIFSLPNLVSLDLSNCHSDDPLPSSIYSFRNLTSLESLHTSSNYFMNSPSLLNGLSSNLKLLDISFCGISSSVLDSIHNLTSLISLDLSGNQLTKEIPNLFGNLCNLRDIDLSGNNFGNTGLTCLLKSLFECNLSGLESLSIFNSGLTGPIPNSIGKISSLKRLYLYGNRLNGSIPESIRSLLSLEELNLSGNKLSGSIPDWIGQLTSLEFLYLSYNHFSSNLPVSLSELSKLSGLDLSYNLLTGVVTESHFAKLVSLKYLELGGNNLTLKLQVPNWIPPFQLYVLNLNSWVLGPEFPSWLQSQRDLLELDISQAQSSSPMPPKSFWKSFPELLILDMSKIKLEGMKKTLSLSLGHNNLSGVIPECWKKWLSLKILILEKNNLSGKIPRTLGSLQNLSWLNMHENKISGKLPSSLMNLSRLVILQLGKNKLAGNIPPWIGTKLSFLGILNLRSNSLDGNIPNELCYLSKTQILDLAENNLSGNIPRCFNNFSALRGITDSINNFNIVLESLGQISPSDTLVMKGQEYTYQSILGLVTLLDLSSNNFFGNIPSEITSLRELKSLNLSRNQLRGRIPDKIGDMEELESFDLSVNKLTGELPISLSRLNFLSSFNVSYNNLTGRVPIGTQLQSFDESSFYGNQLCGSPLRGHCVPIEALTHTIGDQKKDDRLEWGLIISIVLGFVIGFWIILSPLIISTSWRITYFGLMNKLIKI